MENDRAVLWLIEMRRLRARERLEFQRDLNAGFFPECHKMLKMWLAEMAFLPDDPTSYENARDEISSIQSVRYHE